MVALASRAYEAAISSMGRGRLFSALRLRIWGRMEAAGMLLGTVPAERDRGLLLYLKSRADRERWKDLCKCDTPHTTSQCSPEQVRISGTAATSTGCFTFTGGPNTNL